jgi:hypothetical protein
MLVTCAPQTVDPAFGFLPTKPLTSLSDAGEPHHPTGIVGLISCRVGSDVVAAQMRHRILKHAQVGATEMPANLEP